jgi:hypothetical protein
MPARWGLDDEQSAHGKRHEQHKDTAQPFAAAFISGIVFHRGGSCCALLTASSNAIRTKSVRVIAFLAAALRISSRRRSVMRILVFIVGGLVMVLLLVGGLPWPVVVTLIQSVQTKSY